MRSLGGYFLDIFSFRFVNIWHRLLTNLNFREDHYNTFSKLLEIKKEYKVTTLFFFLIGDYTTFDKNISFSNNKFKYFNFRDNKIGDNGIKAIAENFN